jgi:hypothetical protein
MYALVAGAGRPRRAAGIGGEPIRIVRMAGVDAAVGVLRRVPKPTVAAMRRYDEVQRELMRGYVSVLPARFGTCAASLDHLAVSIRDRRDAIRRNLRLVRGRTQMTVRVFSGSESSLNHPRTTSETVQSRFTVGSEYGDREAKGTEYLQRRMAEIQIPGAGPLRRAVSRWVRAELTERHRAGRLAGTLYHLVPRTSVPAYRQAAERAARDAGLTIVVTGPWPPYAFAE